MERVYVAGVYSYVPDGANAPTSVFENMRKGIKAALRIWQLGFAPFCPWLDYLYCLMREEWVPEVEDFYGMSIAWLSVSDYMVVLPENIQHSRGVQLEIDKAEELGIPIFYSMDEFEAYVCSEKYKGVMNYGCLPPPRQGYVPTMGDLDEQPSLPQSCDCCSTDEGYARKPCCYSGAD